MIIVIITLMKLDYVIESVVMKLEFIYRKCYSWNIY